MFTELAGLVTTLILPKLLDKASEEIGQKLGSATFEKSSQAINKIKEVTHTKLKQSGTEGLLTRYTNNPNQKNIQALQAEIVNLMDEDPAFATELKQLVDEVSPSLQIVLDTIRVKGNVDVGNINQSGKGGSAEQIVARNVGVGGDLKLGDINQTIS